MEKFAWLAGECERRDPNGGGMCMTGMAQSCLYMMESRDGQNTLLERTRLISQALPYFDLDERRLSALGCR